MRRKELQKSQIAFTCSKSKIEKLEKGVKYALNQEHLSGVFVVNF